MSFDLIGFADACLAKGHNEVKVAPETFREMVRAIAMGDSLGEQSRSITIRTVRGDARVTADDGRK